MNSEYYEAGTFMFASSDRTFTVKIHGEERQVTDIQLRFYPLDFVTDNDYELIEASIWDFEENDWVDCSESELEELSQNSDILEEIINDRIL